MTETTEQKPTVERLVDGQGRAWSDLQLLYEVMKALQSIRGMLQFFVLLAIISLLLGGCTVFMSLMSR